jgi:hypothetical protein
MAIFYFIKYKGTQQNDRRMDPSNANGFDFGIIIILEISIEILLFAYGTIYNLGLRLKNLFNRKNK